VPGSQAAGGELYAARCLKSDTGVS